MTKLLLPALAAAIVAGLLTNLMIPFVTRIALAVRAVDDPGGRKRHRSGSVPRLGGVAIALGIALASGGAFLYNWPRMSRMIPRSELAALIVATGLIFVVGVVDDLVGVSVWKKFLLEALAAWLMIQVGWSFEVLDLPFAGSVQLGALGSVLSLVWLVGVTNAINLIDGLDGLAGGVAAIIAGSLFAYSFLQGNVGSVLLMAATAGACVGFLRHNWAPAKIFMGDSGSLTLGFLLAAISIHSSLKAPAAVAILVPLAALGVPVIDTLLVMLVRFLERPKGRIWVRFGRMFIADRNHLHHLLESYAANRKRIVWIIYSLVLTFSALAVVVAATRSGAAGLLLVMVEFLVILGIRHSSLRREARILSEAQRAEAREALSGFEEKTKVTPISARRAGE